MPQLDNRHKCPGCLKRRGRVMPLDLKKVYQGGARHLDYVCQGCGEIYSRHRVENKKAFDMTG